MSLLKTAVHSLLCNEGELVVLLVPKPRPSQQTSPSPSLTYFPGKGGVGLVNEFSRVSRVGKLAGDLMHPPETPQIPFSGL